MQNIQSDNDLVLASRWSRFWATVIDSLVLALCSAPWIIYMLNGAADGTGVASVYVYALTALLWIITIAFQCYLMHRHGQTIGKNVFEIAMVDLEGNKPGLAKLIFLRMLPVHVLSYANYVGSFVPLINVLFIFRKDRRCLHDLIAGTQVISVAKPKQVDFSTFD
ncbi:RDD family protein [Vibrio sinaloensis]|nr:RDD family protein [Vibrio sinaloensis]